MNEKYNNVEITDEEMESLNDPIVSDVSTDSVDETTESQNRTTDEESSDIQEVTESDVVAEKFNGLEIDGKAYDADTIKSWMDDANNKSEWQKSNTEKAQNLSKWNKFVEKVNEDEEFRNHIKGFFDDEDDISKLGLNSKIGLEIEDAKDTETPSEIESRLIQLEKFEEDRIMETRVNVLDDELTQLEQRFPEYLDKEGQVQEFLNFAEANGERFVVDGLPSLEKAFREWSYDQMQDELNHYKKLGENSSRNKGKVINRSQVGAKEVKSPKKVLSWNDATMDDPEIAKYFEE
tara:strand:+ start:2361 stop:3236 length:876 start_codon:yes stop_codon:yes gene_type:complete